MSLIEIFKAGGPLMWALALCSLGALAIIIERSISLRASQILKPAIAERISGLAEGGRVDRALEVAQEDTGIFHNIISAGLEVVARGENEQTAKEAVEDAGRHAMGRLNRYLGILGTIVGVSPLIGLLGTVTGMIQVFNTIAQEGAGGAAELSGGISTALITTATGLLIAIPSLVAYNFFRGKVEMMILELESDSLRVLRSCYQPATPRITQAGS